MAQLDIHTCSSLKGKEIHSDEGNGGDQTQCNASVKSWFNQVKEILNSQHKMWQVSENVCIYRVPKPLMNSKEEAYVPLVVPLGLYHHKINPKLSRMDQHKLEAVRRMLTKLPMDMDISTLIAKIQKLECQIRECYEEPIGLDGKTLSLMLAMDACFILEFFREWKPVNVMYFAILFDIMKLENQIPLKILITLLELEFESTERAKEELANMLSKCDVMHEFSYPFSFDGDKSKLKEHIMKEPPPCHLLDLSRMVINDLLTNSNAESRTPVEPDGSCGTDVINNDHGPREWLMNVAVPDRYPLLSPALSSDDNSSASSVKSSNGNSCASSVESSDDIRSTPTAELLEKAGIKFQPGHLRFEKSTLSLPQITFEDNTETLLRNLIAYEECQRGSSEETVISHFVAFFDDLIDSAKDVSVLRESLVIKSFLGNDEVIARMLNRLGDGITLHPIQQIEVVKSKARKHYKRQWNVWMTQLKDEYFSKPWSIISFLAAILALLMTAVQTVYSVKN